VPDVRGEAVRLDRPLDLPAGVRVEGPFSEADFHVSLMDKPSTFRDFPKTRASSAFILPAGAFGHHSGRKLTRNTISRHMPVQAGGSGERPVSTSSIICARSAADAVRRSCSTSHVSWEPPA